MPQAASRVNTDYEVLASLALKLGYFFIAARQKIYIETKTCNSFLDQYDDPVLITKEFLEQGKVLNYVQPQSTTSTFCPNITGKND